MPSFEQFKSVLNRRFRKANNRDMDEGHMKWAYEAFRLGYTKGQDDFMKDHDWYE